MGVSPIFHFIVFVFGANQENYKVGRVQDSPV